MKRSSYRDRDYAFGQTMLTLRTNIGLTQTGLADYLHVSRRAVGEWEAGSSYPKVEHVKQLITLAIKQRAFPTGHEAEAIREFWQISRQKVLLDEHWLAGLLTGQTGANVVVKSPIPVTIQADIPRLNGERKSTVKIPFQPTTFIGRSDELTEIARLLSDPSCRLLTLIGPGGIGKTRLAIEVAQGQTKIFKDGVVFVPLASIGTPNQIISAVGTAFNLSFAGQSNPITHLLEYLREKHVLLVLDNFEHVLEGSDLVYDILQHAPYATILITSRVRLNLQAEWLFDVEGLPYPQSDAQDLTDLTQYAAVKLFIQRAMQVQITFQASQSTLRTIVGICQQVAGMPLAIELAAAGVRTLSVAEIEEQIRSNLDGLTTSLRDVPARHRSLRAVFDHSWNLLSEAERTLLSRLAVFRGSCTADAAEKVTGATLLQLLKLVDKSLLRQISAPNTPEPRFFLLEPIREYALEKLKFSGELQIYQRIHANYYLRLVEIVTEQWQLQGVYTALEQIDHEIDNVRAALQWAAESDMRFGVQLAGTLARYWRSRGYLTEGRNWLEGFLALDEENTDSELIHARLWAVKGAGWIAVDQHDFEQAKLLFEQEKMLRNILGETEDDASTLANAGLQARANGQYGRATLLLEDMLAQLRALGDRGTLGSGGLGFSLYALGLVLREQSYFERAIKLFEECIEFHRAINDREAMTQGMLGLSDVARDQGNAADVRKYAEQCLETFREIGTQWAIGFSLNNLAMAAYLEGKLSEAHALVNESLALFRNHNSHGSIAEVLVTLGHILLAQGDLVAASDAFTESLRLAFTTGPRLLVVADLEGLASVMTEQGQIQFAIRFLALASELRSEMGTPVRPVDQPIVEQALAVAKEALGNDIFTAIWVQAEKMPLEQILRESPFSELLIQSAEAPVTEQPIRSTETEPARESGKPIGDRRVDWGDALAAQNFYGREWEMSLLKEWVIEERCQVVSVLGMGGIGKSALTVSLMHQVAEHFEVVIWRSLRDLPTWEVLLDDLLQLIAPHTFHDIASSSERKTNILLDQMRTARTLIVLDNLETVLEEGEGQGQMRPSYEGLAHFLRLSAETKHQSCVMLTSREKPGVLIALEGSRSTVRVLRLERLSNEACKQLLAEKDVLANPQEYERLIESYTGNPLALKIVAQTIIDLFDGSIAPFLEQGEVIFGGVRELLSEQFARLSNLEQSVLLWLAIMREPLTFNEFAKILVTPVPRGRLLEAVESLRRRSLIERGLQPGSFTLQSVVLEYVTSRLVMEVTDEIQANKFSHLIEYGLELAQSREYVRQTQQRVITVPILQFLRAGYPQKDAVEGRLLALLNELSTWPEDSQGYAPANLVALLHLQRGNLRGIDLSRLTLRGVYLQGVAMQNASLAGAVIKDSIFTETFDALTAVAISGNGMYWAAASRRGEIRIWTTGGQILHRSWQAHADMVYHLAFTLDNNAIVTGGWDGVVKLWDIRSMTLLWSGKHASHINNTAFSPDGHLLATYGSDATIRLWDRQRGSPLHTLSQPVAVSGDGATWSPDGKLFASGDQDGVIRLWEMNETGSPTCIQTIPAHTGWLDGLAFSPDGHILASAGFDGHVKLWDIPSGNLLHTLTGHNSRVFRVAWSPDGRTLASSSFDQTIWLWDVEQRSYRVVLRGHTAGVVSVAFSPDSNILFSGSEDGTLRVWDITSGECIRVTQGYTESLYDVDWSPDGTHLVTGGSDALVTIWNVSGNKEPRLLRGHGGVVVSATWNPNGRLLASVEWDNSIRLWDETLEVSVQVIQYPDDQSNFFHGLAWSPDGHRLAAGTYAHGVAIFDTLSQRFLNVGRQFHNWIRYVAWSPDGTRLVGGDDNDTISIWNAEDNVLLQQFTGYKGTTMVVTWSPDGNYLATGTKGPEVGELFVWNIQRGERVWSFTDPSSICSAIAWDSTGARLISGGGDGILRWWNVETGECLWTIEAHRGTIYALRRSPDGHIVASCGADGAIMLWEIETGQYLKTIRRDRPYERLNITGIRGLTEAQKMSLRALGAIELN